MPSFVVSSRIIWEIPPSLRYVNQMQQDQPTFLCPRFCKPLHDSPIFDRIWQCIRYVSQMQLFSEPGFQGSVHVVEDSVSALPHSFSLGSNSLQLGPSCQWFSRQHRCECWRGRGWRSLCHADWVRITDWKLQMEGGAWHHCSSSVNHGYLQGNTCRHHCFAQKGLHRQGYLCK